VFAFHSLARALAAYLPRQDHIYSTTDESFRIHNKDFDEMRCKLDSTENPRSFEKIPNHTLTVTFGEPGRKRFSEKKMEFASQVGAKRILFYFQPNSDRSRTRFGAVHDDRAE